MLNMVLDHQASNDWRGVCERCVPGRKVFTKGADADVESAADAPGADEPGAETT